LNSDRAIVVNIAIIRAFVKLREVMATHKDLAQKVEALERKYKDHDEEIQVIFKAIKKLLEPPPQPPKRRIGFRHA
jgi:membrane protein insertase Oxa1/YidC/SpoIIIJ